MLSRVKLTNAHAVRGKLPLKNNTECFLGMGWSANSKKLSRHSMASKTRGPHRRKDKSEYQECTCKMDEFEQRNVRLMFNKRTCWLEIFMTLFWLLK